MPDQNSAPVHDTSPDHAEEGIALCLSGGGYRAMVFHAGCLWRLNEAGLLGKLNRISSVSGGSITSGILGMNWGSLQVAPGAESAKFKDIVVAAIRKVASTTIDEGAIFGGIFLPGSISDHVAGKYDDVAFHGKTLQDLPAESTGAQPAPRFVFNATNVQSGVLMRFSRPYMSDYKVGKIDNPTLPLAKVVAASSAFPPVLSPCEIDVSKYKLQFVPAGGETLHFAPYTTKLVLSDGGVYDNLGLETAWKRYKTLLVSDGGALLQPEPEPHDDWARHAYRVLDIIDSQVRALRTRQLIGAYQTKERTGAYWGIATEFSKFANRSQLPCTAARTAGLAAVDTRLKAMDDSLQERLINWGYAVCDASLRTWYDFTLPQPRGFPYPATGV